MMSSILRSLPIIVPSTYKPYRVLDFCSNKLINVQFQLEVGGLQKPLLIGRGVGSPNVWIAAPTDTTRQTWSWVVERNTTRHPRFHVTQQGKTTSVLAGGLKVLEATELQEDQAILSFVDLRPVGLRLHGDRSILYAGGHTFQTNTVEDTYVFMALG